MQPMMDPNTPQPMGQPMQQPVPPMSPPDQGTLAKIRARIAAMRGQPMQAPMGQGMVRQGMGQIQDRNAGMRGAIDQQTQ